MARARTIKPGFFSNDQLGDLPPLTRILFVGLWTLADREGRLLDRPKKFKAELLPYDRHNVEQALEQLAERGFILRYTVGGVACIQILNWLVHQHIHPKEDDSQLPPPPGSKSHASTMHELSNVDASVMHDDSMGHASTLARAALTSSSGSLTSSSGSLPSGSSSAAAPPPNGAVATADEGSPTIEYEQIVEKNGRVRQVLVEHASAQTEPGP